MQRHLKTGKSLRRHWPLSYLSPSSLHFRHAHWYAYCMDRPRCAQTSSKPPIDAHAWRGHCALKPTFRVWKDNCSLRPWQEPAYYTPTRSVPKFMNNVTRSVHINTSKVLYFYSTVCIEHCRRLYHKTSSVRYNAQKSTTQNILTRNQAWETYTTKKNTQGFLGGNNTRI